MSFHGGTSLRKCKPAPRTLKGTWHAFQGSTSDTCRQQVPEQDASLQVCIQCKFASLRQQQVCKCASFGWHDFNGIVLILQLLGAPLASVVRCGWFMLDACCGCQLRACSKSVPHPVVRCGVVWCRMVGACCFLWLSVLPLFKTRLLAAVCAKIPVTGGQKQADLVDLQLWAARTISLGGGWQLNTNQCISVSAHRHKSVHQYWCSNASMYKCMSVSVHRCKSVPQCISVLVHRLQISVSVD